MGKDDFKYFINPFDTNVFDLVKQKRFDRRFKKCKEQLINKEKNYSWLTKKSIVAKSMSKFLRRGINLTEEVERLPRLVPKV